MCFGTPRLITDPEEKISVLKTFVERLFPGRWDALRPPNDYEMKATSILAMKLTEASAKLRSAPPGDDPEDTAWPVWAGVIPGDRPEYRDSGLLEKEPSRPRANSLQRSA